MPPSDEAATIAGMKAVPVKIIPTIKDHARQHWLKFFFGVLFLVTVGVVWWLSTGLFAETWPQPSGTASPKMEGMRNYFWSVGVVAAGIVGVWGFALAAVRTHALHRQAKTAEKDSTHNEKKHAVETDLAQRKHDSDAFATAINLLGQHGSDNFAIRLGAVYALESLAKSAHDLHGPIFETLCAYVRQEAPAPKDDDLSAKIAARNKDSIDEIIDEHLKSVAKPDVVVQAILTVIGRRDPTRDPKDFRIDLQETDLRTYDLKNGKFSGARLTKAYLARALLDLAHLEGAQLFDAHLEGAYLVSAHLEGANLNEARLTGAHLVWAHLEGAGLNDAQLEGALLFRAHLEGTRFVRARLKGAYLGGVFFNAETAVQDAQFFGARAIPAHSGADFRATVKDADKAQWPADVDPDAWDRGNAVLSMYTVQP